MHILTAQLFALSAFFWCALANSVPEPAPGPPIDQVQIKSVTYAGSGCPAGTVASAIVSGGSFHIQFNSFIAKVYPGSKPSESRKNCQLSLELQYPAGWSFTITQFSGNGYLKLDKDVTATLQSTFRWGGQSAVATFRSNWVGPLDKNYYIDKSLVKGDAWSPCNGPSGTLIINTAARVGNRKNKQGSGSITVVNPIALGSKWRKC
ncbi:hypothetical protein EV426DRAFT_549622 [Tirmania nivea]|nr:hypothetical protein EV426DRAFT_549622 [Tirmania nivea]